MDFRKCLKTLQMAKALTLDYVIENGPIVESGQIRNLLTKEIGNQWDLLAVFHLMNIFDDAFELVELKGTNKTTWKLNTDARRVLNVKVKVSP